MSTPQDKHPSKSSFSDTSDNFEGAEKQIKGSGSSLPQNERGGRWCSASLSNHAVEANEIQLNDNKDTICYYTSISSQGAEDSAWLHCNWREYKQLSLWKSTPTLKQSCNRTSQESPSIPISETTTQSQENLTSSQWDFPAREQATQEAEQDSSIQHLCSGEKDLDALSKLNPSSVLWNSLKELSDEDFELFLADSVWQDTLGKLKQSRRESLAHHTKDSDYLSTRRLDMLLSQKHPPPSFPTLTSNASSTSRPAGQTKCDCAPRTAEGNRWFKDKGLIPSGYQLSAQAMALIMGFPLKGATRKSWFLTKRSRRESYAVAHLNEKCEF